MEKFSTWRDQGTGVHPFIDSKSRASVGIGIFASIIRIPFLIIVTLWYALFSSIVFALATVPLIGKFLRRYIDVLGCRVILFLLSFHYINSKVITLKKSSKSNVTIKSGEFIISNHVSYIDLLYFTYKYSPIYVYPTNNKKDKEEEKVVMYTTIWGALNHIIHEKEIPSDQLITLKQCKEISKKMEVPIVFFPEGCTTTGQVLLECNNLLLNSSILSNTPCHVVTFKYDYATTGQNPSYTIGNIYYHLFVLTSSWNTNVDVRYLSDDDVLTSKDAPIVPNPTNISIVNQNYIVNLLSQCLRSRVATLNLFDKLEFRNYFYNYKSKSK